jgi:hypothetical protein
MRRCDNIQELAAVTVLDNLTWNQDQGAKHFVFEVTNDTGDRFRFFTVDYGWCLGIQGGWDTLRAPTPWVNPVFPELISGEDPFGPCLGRLSLITEAKVRKCLEQIPLDEWGVRPAESDSLVAYLAEQRSVVPQMISEKKEKFPNWR